MVLGTFRLLKQKSKVLVLNYFLNAEEKFLSKEKKKKKELCQYNSRKAKDDLQLHSCKSLGD